LTLEKDSATPETYNIPISTQIYGLFLLNVEKTPILHIMPGAHGRPKTENTKQKRFAVVFHVRVRCLKNRKRETKTFRETCFLFSSVSHLFRCSL
jgi:hypothetical protein